jgi:oxygen-independent coproporphyrinogen-3 oxidase
MAGIYIHIPFCKKRCIYCDFYSTTLDNTWKKEYITALCQEIQQRKEELKNETITTLYFGGGTPSQLNIDDFKIIFDTLKNNFSLSNCEEITLEANPDDINATYLKQIKTLPFNRISLGVQSFHNEMLQQLNRRHNATQAIEAVKACQKYGFTNISIDLMYGLPGQTLKDWEKDIQQAITLNPTHISAYHLIYEENTTLWKLREEKKVTETNEELSLSFFATLIKKLKTAGFEHYEISNFAQPNYASKHNSSYWEGIPYLGLGPSAHSFDGEYRKWNISNIKTYIDKIKKGESILEIEESTLYTRYNDFIITALRTAKGLNLKHLKHTFGKQLYQHCIKCAQPYLKQGTMQQENQRLFITPDGIFISDGIMSDLLYIEN